MATGTQAPSLEVLQDRWDAVMDWDRNGGNSTEEYVELVSAIHTLVHRVSGVESDEDGEAVDEIAARMRDLVIDVVQARGLAR